MLLNHWNYAKVHFFFLYLWKKVNKNALCSGRWGSRDGIHSPTPGSCCSEWPARWPSVAEHLPHVSNCGPTIHLQHSLLSGLVLYTGVNSCMSYLAFGSCAILEGLVPASWLLIGSGRIQERLKMSSPIQLLGYNLEDRRSRLMEKKEDE